MQIIFDKKLNPRHCLNHEIELLIVEVQHL